MKQFSSLLGLVAFVVVLSGCASKFYIPGNRFMSPESSGEFLKGDVKVGLVGVTDIQVADNVTSASPDTTPKLIKNTSVDLGLQLGLVERLDGYVNIVGKAPGFGGLKFQLLGDSKAQAKAGNLSVAVAGGLAMKSNLSTYVESSTLKGVSTIDPSGWEAMVLVGYRPMDNTLIYLTPFMTHISAKVTVERTENGVTTTTARPDGQGDMRGVSLGFRLGSSAFLAGEASLTNTKWTRDNPTSLAGNEFSDIALGLAGGASW